MEYESTRAAARELGLDSSSVSACCLGRTKRAGMFPEYEFELAPLAEDQQDKPGEAWRDVLLAETDRTAGPVPSESRGRGTVRLCNLQTECDKLSTAG